MANDAEKKNIARLDFDVNSAINNLEKVDKKLKTLSESSEAYAKKIGKNLGSSINGENFVNTQSINKQLNEITDMSKKTKDNLNAQLIKKEKGHQDKITEIAFQTEKAKELAAYKSTLKQEEYNNRILKSTKTVYDKIGDYAKTYLIYQGFNQLRQGITETIDEMVDLEYQMVQIDRVLNEQGLNIDLYRDKLIKMAYQYGNSFDNVADITLRLAQAGFDSQESLMLSEKTLLALNTAELDATQATEDMVAVMAQWGLMTGTATKQAESYGNIIDKINNVADRFPVTSADILEALKKTSSAFNLAGASIDETIASIVAAETASQRGGKAIGTALNNIMTQLKDDKRLNILESLGIDVYKDATKQEFKDIMDIIEQLSERMQMLKDQGKENSVEMQNLLEVFTVFRRNIGSSLLGEMAGEDSTYAEVLTTSINSVGYSLQENEKHMKTAKAAQAQFNATLLELKTTVWDNGLEDVFRAMLLLGSDVAKMFGGMIETFGAAPTAIALAITAFTTFNKSVQAFSYDVDTGSIKLGGFFKKIADGTKEVRKANAAFKTMKDGQIALAGVQGRTLKSYAKNTVEVGKYTASLVAATAKTVLLEAATIALNAALSMGISLAISAIISGIQHLINAEQEAIEKNNELIASSQENAAALEEEAERVRELYNEYRTLVRKEDRTPEEEQKIYEIQENLNALLKDTGEKVELITTEINEQGEAVRKVNENYNEQLIKIKEIQKQKKEDEIDEKKTANQVAQENLKGITSLDSGFWDSVTSTSTTRVRHALQGLEYDFSSLLEELYETDEITDSMRKRLF